MLKTSDMHILILGTGSVGKRHARNLKAIGCNISCFDPHAERTDELSSEIKTEKKYVDLDVAFKDFRQFNGVVIASPPKYHVDQCIRSLKTGLPVLLEKPVSPTLNDAQLIHEHTSHAPLLLGYTWRWWKPLIKVKELLAGNSIGEIYHVRMSMSAHLADWHPWEDYRAFFMASKELGGGALLDESHWIDLMLWIFGKPTSLYAQISRISALDIETDDNVDLLVNYNGKSVVIHLDLYGRPHEKRIVFSGEKGSICWTVEPNQIQIGARGNNEWEVVPYTIERNDMFMDLANEFVRVINGEPVKTCSLEDGLNVLRFIETARQSSALHRLMEVNW